MCLVICTKRILQIYEKYFIVKDSQDGYKSTHKYSSGLVLIFCDVSDIRHTIQLAEKANK